MAGESAEFQCVLCAERERMDRGMLSKNRCGKLGADSFFYLIRKHYFCIFKNKENRMKKIFLILFGIMFLSFSAQQKKHTVEAKETLYSIAKKYGVTVDELIKQNPKSKDGKLDIGEVLIIPNNQKNSPKIEDKKEEKKLGKIYLQPKQTIYSITKQYKITEAQLRKLNPDLDNHMKIGDAVVLPEENIKKYGDVSTQATVANDKTDIPKNSVKGTESGTYVVQPKDTYYGITRKFGISQKELFSMNEGLEQRGLQAGDVIIIKKGSNDVAKVSQKETKSYELGDYVTYKVQKGDTLLGILKKFNITYEQLSQLNDGVENGLNPGMELRIKKIENQFASKEKGAVNMVIMLPFGLDSNDNKYKNLALDFLAGAKMAAERSLKNGKKININVIDSESETAVKNSLEQINKSNTDIIIGPFFKSNVLEVSDHVRKEKIPVIAPFAHASDMYNQENLVLVETSVRTYTEKIIQEVKQVYSGQKIYIIGEKDNEEVAYLKEQFEKVLSKADVAVSASASGIELEENMMTGQKLPIIMVLATDKEDTGTAFSKKIIQLVSQSDGIKAFSMYYNSNFEKNIDELSKSNLVYLMDRKINVEGSFEKEVLEDFKKKYCKTPSKYNIIGFDVVNDALERQQAGGFLKNIDKVQTQLATKFEYVRTKRNGAYANTGYRVVRLIP